MKRAVALAVTLAGGVLAVALIAAMLDLTAAPVRLAAAVSANLPKSGVEHPVTAVLLNFRGYDTLLEIAVLLLALIGVLAVVAPPEGPAPASTPEPVLQGVAGWAAPLMALVAVYLLWAGAHRPGGAFQAGSVLAAAAVLLNLADIIPAWGRPRPLLRAGVAGGFLVFLTVAVFTLPVRGTLLAYPPEAAKALILAVEAGLTVSLGLILAGLFLFLGGDST